MSGETIKAVLTGYAGGVITSAEARRQREAEHEVKRLAMLADLEPLEEPIPDVALAKMLDDNEQDYYGTDMVPLLIAEIKRLRAGVSCLHG
jgi:hypothetical protein